MTQPDTSYVLMPGDTLILVYKRALTTDQMNTLKEYSAKIGIKCAVVTGCDDLFIRRANAPTVNVHQSVVVDGSQDMDQIKTEVGKSIKASLSSI